MPEQTAPSLENGARQNAGSDQRDGIQQKVVWNDDKMASTYANVCNVTSTREEVTLFFGISSPSTTVDQQITIDLSDRVILSPFAAKRMAALLNKTIEEHEKRFGELPLSFGATSAD